jgi:Protein of unknown function (DUF3037)
MPELRRFKLYIVRYVGSVINQEFVNIGVCLAEYSDGPQRFVGFKSLANWDRLQAFFPHAEVAFLKEWCAALRRQLDDRESRDVALEKLEASDSAISVFIETKAVLTREDPEVEMRTLVNMYLV